MDEDADNELSILLTIGVAELTYNHFRKNDRRLNMMRYMTLKNLSIWKKGKQTDILRVRKINQGCVKIGQGCAISH